MRDCAWSGPGSLLKYKSTEWLYVEVCPHEGRARAVRGGIPAMNAAAVFPRYIEKKFEVPRNVASQRAAPNTANPHTIHITRFER